MINNLIGFKFKNNSYVVTVDKMVDNFVEFQILNLTTKTRMFGKIQKGFGLELSKNKAATSILSYNRDSEFFKATYAALIKLYKGVK
jgi:hypothetical protein